MINRLSKTRPDTTRLDLTTESSQDKTAAKTDRIDSFELDSIGR